MEEVLDDKVVTKSEETFKIENDKAIYVFKNTNKDALGDKINEYLIKEGYQIEQGNKVIGVYGKGNKVMRILFGAFVKRFEWHVEINDINGSTGLIFTKNSKGYAGGVIGVQQVKKEFSRIVELLKAYQQNHNSK